MRMKKRKPHRKPPPRCWCGVPAVEWIQHRVYDRDERAGYRADLAVCGRHGDAEGWPERVHDEALRLALAGGRRMTGDERSVMEGLDERGELEN